MAGSDFLRFPPGISVRVAAEIVAIAWHQTDLLRDIPEFQPDAEYLASTYADVAADVWEEDKDCPPGYLPHRIIDAARKALIPRIEAEIERREALVWAEYQCRLHAGRIDVNGVGDVPSYYELEDTVGPAAKDGPDSDAPSWMSPEVSIMSPAAKIFHFICPECGFTDAELGPADLYEDHCQVCMEDERVVRLKCWPMDDDDTSALQALVPARWSSLPRRQHTRHR